MSVALRRPMSLDESLAWEREQDLRYEFDGIQPIAMTDGTIDHSVIGTNVVFALDSRLREPCRAFRSDLKILVEEHMRYPDVVVTCSPLDGSSDVIPEPVVVFEVLSASTAPVDRGPKTTEYQATSSIQHYVMLEQTRAGALVVSCEGDDWTETRVVGLDSTMRLTAVGVDLPMAELCRRIRLGG